jgi:DNA primase catalytic subunit
VESPESTDKGSKKARELLEYLKKNQEGLIPYQRRGIKLPKEPQGIVYKNLGTQENHNCSVITQRMKHRRMSWSMNGGNNMAKLLVRKENKTLYDTIERYTDGIIMAARLNEVVEVLSAAKAPKYDGKGNKDGNIQKGHFALRDAMMTASRKALIRAFG